MQPLIATASEAAEGTGRLNPDRFFDPDVTTRRVARRLYEATSQLPLICPHGHVDPRILAGDEPFPEPAALFITPDHYIFRMLYSRGVSMESLGIPTRDGSVVEQNARRIWQTFADNYYLFAGTPTGAWMDYELAVVFGIQEKLTSESAAGIYEQLNEKLSLPEYKPRALFERFNIEVLATTDRESDSLTHHAAIRDSGWKGRVVPTFRPDAVMRIASPTWKEDVAALAKSVGYDVADYQTFERALRDRRDYFKTMGATATDHAVIEPWTHQLSFEDAEALFQRALAGSACGPEQRAFEAHMLMVMARMSLDDGLVMQLHAGAMRDHNIAVAKRFGADKGADIPVVTEYTRNLHALLNAYGNDPRLTLILFTLDETTYARELAPLAGHYPAVKLGPPWWFNDSIEGMKRFRQQTTETAGIYNTAGFNDDTRAFCSIPARHDLCRRVDANFLAGLVTRHVIDESDAREMAHALAYGLAKETYRFQ
ncbi:MAG TPA: glucuronate isomerase [Longimicrobiales bacterium]|nr:glucuronate isomerase [Longimicrobiales bacterium]